MADLSRCPDCALPLVWLVFPGTSRGEHRCTGDERHAQLDRMKRAASACRLAGREDFADAILRDIERLSAPTSGVRAA